MASSDKDSHLFGLYIHWPFCLSKCPYCDFNSHVHAKIDEAAWEKALISQIKHWHSKTPHRKLTSIFFGGGTPSLMSPKLVGRLLETAEKTWGFAENIEITLEANPTSIEQNKFQGFQKAGVNRVSVGIQSLLPEALRFLGRTHSADEGKRAIDIARNTFKRYSFDLIYTRPDQTLGTWEIELQEALSYTGHHLSLYQLTIEKQTPFHLAFMRGDFKMPDEDNSVKFYTRTNEIMAHHDFKAYEVSNYAKPGEACRHNLTYWRSKDYVGIGPGAHGRLTIGGKKYATRQHRAPTVWLEKATEMSPDLTQLTPLSQKDIFQEKIIMGLRLEEGIEKAPLKALSPADYSGLGLDNKARILLQNGYLTNDTLFLRLTPEGRLRLNSVVDYLLNRT